MVSAKAEDDIAAMEPVRIPLRLECTVGTLARRGTTDNCFFAGRLDDTRAETLSLTAAGM